MNFDYNNNTFTFKDLFKLHVLLAFLFITIPMLSYANYLLHGVKTTWLVFILWIVVVRIFNRGTVPAWLSFMGTRKAEFFSLGVFVFLMLVYYVFVRENGKSLNYVTSFSTMFMVLVMDSYYAVIHPKHRQSVLFLCVLCLGIQAAISIPYLLSADSFVTRLYASGALSEAESLDAIKHGVGDNGLYSSVAAVVFAAYASGLKMAPKFKYLIYGAIVPIVISILASSFLACILLLSIGLLLLMFVFRRKLLTSRALFALVACFIGVSFFYTYYLSETDLLLPVVDKAEGLIKNFGRSGFSADTDVTGRAKLANVSINTFMDNPLFGIGIPPNRSFNLIGEHMPWVDYLANFGLLGCIPFFSFLLLLFKKNKKRYFSKRAYSFGNTKLYNKAMLVGFIIFILSNFISPMVTIPSAFIMLLFWYTSFDQYMLNDVQQG